MVIVSTDYWIKSYHADLDDPALAMLPDRLWRRYHELSLVAGRVNGMIKIGSLPDTASIAWMLRMPTEDLEGDLNELEKHSLVNRTEAGWNLPGFAARQGPVPDVERKRKSRERELIGTIHSHEDVTKRDTEHNKAKQKTDNMLMMATSNIFQLYAQNIGTLTPLISDKLKAAEAEFDSTWIEWAFEQAVTNNARNWAYIEACLRNRRDGHEKQPGNNGKRPAPIPAQSIAEKVAMELYG